jgi:hypothetical protein
MTAVIWLEAVKRMANGFRRYILDHQLAQTLVCQ